MTANSVSWLSASAEVLVKQLEQSAGQVDDCDLLIVGSGYGGAVAAARFAGTTVDDGRGGQRPARIWVVERGREYLRGMFPSRFSELPGHVRFSKQDGAPPRGYAEALFDVRIGDDVNVLLGNGLGGGSLINAGVMEEPDPAVFKDHWEALEGDDLQTEFSQAREMLGVAPTPEKLRKFVALQDIATSNGSTASLCSVAVSFAQGPNRVGVGMEACTNCGDCLIGCNQGAKGTLDTNYLALAASRGASLYCGLTVEKLLAPAISGGPWRAKVHYTDPALRPQGEAGRLLRARAVILAAGSLGSTEILLRSQSVDLSFSEVLGTRFSTNGDMVAGMFLQKSNVGATADQETDPADVTARNVGPTITGLVRTPTETAGTIAVEEFAVPGALSQVFGEVLATFGFTGVDIKDVDSPTGANGQEPLAASGVAVADTGLYGMMGDDGANGRLVLPTTVSSEPSIDGAVRVEWSDLGSNPVFDAQIEWLSKAAGLPGRGGTVVPNPLWKPFNLLWESSPNGGTLLTVHPLGGCPMGRTPREGVVDASGRVFRPGGAPYDRLAVLDGSIVPTALGINPSLTIAAVAERACPRLKEAWGFRDSEAPELRALPERPVWGGRGPIPREPTGIGIRESLQGAVQTNGQYFWARLDVKFAEIGDLSELLRKVDKTVDVKSSVLTLFPATPDDDEFTDRSNLEPVCRVTLEGSVHLFVPNHYGQRDLIYYFVVSKVDIDNGALKLNDAVSGLKEFGKAVGNPWLELSELELSIEGKPAGRLSLDLEDLARRRELLLSVQHQSTSPDALGDLSALGLFVTRTYLTSRVANLTFPKAPGDYPDALIIENLESRYPGKQTEESPSPDVIRIGAFGARLSHYRPTQAAGGARPVVLIHGFGASGSTFAHPSIPNNMVSFLTAKGRDAWVLDLRTSIGNEPPLGEPRGGPWTFDEVALQDIPQAIAHIATNTGNAVDVVAHCIGAAMFCIALLDDEDLYKCVGAVVLSQVTPLLLFSPFNRLRGYVASYTEQYIGTAEFDVRPDFHRIAGADGAPTWARDPEKSRSLGAVDLAISTYPYPHDDTEDAITSRIGVDFRTVRHRSDAIWGHLMESANVADDTWRHLDAINGWVKVQTLAQTIHYARSGLLTDASGRNKSLRQERLASRMAGPILILHGRRNRIFDWRGSLDFFKRMRDLRQSNQPDAPVEDANTLLWGGESDLQLRVVKKYGHQDCIVGETASQDFFGPLYDFLEANAAPRNSGAARTAELPIQFEAPWIGPVLGSLSATAARLTARVLVRPNPRRARTIGVVMIPIDKGDGSFRFELAKGIIPGVPSEAGLAEPHLGARDTLDVDHTEAMLTSALSVALRSSVVPKQFDDFLVLTVHSDLELPLEEVFELQGVQWGSDYTGIEDASGASMWLIRGLPLASRAAAALRDFVKQCGASDTLLCAHLHLTQSACDAAQKESSEPSGPLRFALASCQYPPGLLDAEQAGASYHQLLQECNGDSPPQFLLAIGDQVYVDATAGVFDPGSSGRPGDVVLNAYELNWRLMPFRQVSARTPFYTMIDDHEVRDNWQPVPGVEPDEATADALAAYDVFQQTMNPQPILPSGRHYVFNPLGATVIVLDTRTQRDLRQLGSVGDGVDISRANIVPGLAMSMLFERLKSAPSKAVKFVVSPVPLLPAERFDPDVPEGRLRSDNWSGYPKSVHDLLAFIKSEHIERVVLLSGDAHCSVVTKLLLDDGQAVYAVMSSGLYAPWPFANSRQEEFWLDGPVEFSSSKGSVKGQMQMAAFSSRSGYAIIALAADGDDPQALLQVTLRDNKGGTLDCQHDLRNPGGSWMTPPVQAADNQEEH